MDCLARAGTCLGVDLLGRTYARTAPDPAEFVVSLDLSGDSSPSGYRVAGRGPQGEPGRCHSARRLASRRRSWGNTTTPRGSACS